MACQQISRRPWVGEAVEKWPKTKSRHPVSQRHLQTARVGVPEPPIVLAKAELRVVAYVESFTPLPRRESSSFRGRWGAIGPRVWASGSLAARCAIPASQTRHSRSVWAGFLPLPVHHRASGTGLAKNKNFSHSSRRFSAAAHSIAAIRSSSVKIPIPSCLHFS